MTIKGDLRFDLELAGMDISLYDGFASQGEMFLDHEPAIDLALNVSLIAVDVAHDDTGAAQYQLCGSLHITYEGSIDPNISGRCDISGDRRTIANECAAPC